MINWTDWKIRIFIDNITQFCFPKLELKIEN